MHMPLNYNWQVVAVRGKLLSGLQVMTVQIASDAECVRVNLQTHMA